MKTHPKIEKHNDGEKSDEEKILIKKIAIVFAFVGVYFWAIKLIFL